jgi:inosine-uridine nucleoside N-ribohydrolase
VKLSVWGSFLTVVVSLLCGANAGERPTAPWPPTLEAIPVIIDADAANEIDDQYALALALGFRKRLKVQGLIAAHFGLNGGSEGIENSFKEIQVVLNKAGLEGRIPVLSGSDPIVYRDRIPESEGVDFIIDRARQATPDRPLWLVLLGPATDAAAVLMKAPEVVDRLVIFWHGRTQWPVRCWNFNAYNDIKAVQLLFELPCRFVLFDTGTYLRIHPDEFEERFSHLGPLGAYLHEIRSRREGYLSPRKGFFDLGDIAALVDPASVRWERVRAPAVDHDLRYDFSRDHGEIVRIYHVETDQAFDLLEKALSNLMEY